MAGRRAQGVVGPRTPGSYRPLTGAVILERLHEEEEGRALSTAKAVLLWQLGAGDMPRTVIECGCGLCFADGRKVAVQKTRRPKFCTFAKPSWVHDQQESSVC